MDILTLTPGTVVESKTGRRYTLTELIPAGSGVVARWWVQPLGGGRRKKVKQVDFDTYGWTVV